MEQQQASNSGEIVKSRAEDKGKSPKSINWADKLMSKLSIKNESTPQSNDREGFRRSFSDVVRSIFRDGVDESTLKVGEKKPAAPSLEKPKGDSDLDPRVHSEMDAQEQEEFFMVVAERFKDAGQKLLSFLTEAHSDSEDNFNPVHRPEAHDTDIATEQSVDFKETNLITESGVAREEVISIYNDAPRNQGQVKRVSASHEVEAHTPVNYFPPTENIPESVERPIAPYLITSESRTKYSEGFLGGLLATYLLNRRVKKRLFRHEKVIRKDLKKLQDRVAHTEQATSRPVRNSSQESITENSGTHTFERYDKDSPTIHTTTTQLREVSVASKPEYVSRPQPQKAARSHNRESIRSSRQVESSKKPKFLEKIKKPVEAPRILQGVNETTKVDLIDRHKPTNEQFVASAAVQDSTSQIGRDSIPNFKSINITKENKIASKIDNQSKYPRNLAKKNVLKNTTPTEFIEWTAAVLLLGLAFVATVVLAMG